MPFYAATDDSGAQRVESISKMEDKVQSVVNWPVPSTEKDLKFFGPCLILLEICSRICMHHSSPVSVVTKRQGLSADREMSGF